MFPLLGTCSSTAERKVDEASQETENEIVVTVSPFCDGFGRGDLLSFSFYGLRVISVPVAVLLLGAC